MTVIAIANGAGSAGKTTTAVTLAVLAAQAGSRVRLIDLDPQANATIWTSPFDHWERTAADLIDQTGTIADVEAEPPSTA